MTFKPVLTACLALALGISPGAWAQRIVDIPEWKESEAPPPPAFDFGKLVTFEASPGSSLVFGVDPAAVSISGSDSLVRYVMVATSASGARNVLYEAIRCSTAEVKTYARYSADGHWSPVDSPEWRPLFGNRSASHALRFAQAGACDNTAPATSVQALVQQLKSPNLKR
ncbi:CNP1-like family protein [Polaromonas sp.]|uniref:CNP1-like family protein n=1 Tax=Polaromonas sp. TaxID=1869339 RepID=UPI00286BF3F8|nr:CNP1-like family protein [Polaromonas sp.]